MLWKANLVNKKASVRMPNDLLFRDFSAYDQPLYL